MARMVVTMRLQIAPTSALTDARGHNEKARPCLRSGDRRRAVVSFPDKATGESAANTRAGLHLDASG
jgi:hypothetical protein